MVLTRFFLAAALLLFSSLIIVSAIDYSQGAKPDVGNSVPVAKEKPLPIGVEGHILCKSATSSAPIQGAVARITRLAFDESGYETAPFSFLSDATDANGYFFETLTPSEINGKLQVSQCKAFLQKSPLETCKVPTDVNKGIRGAVLNSYRVLNQMQMKLYWVGPFFYTTEPKSLPDGYS